MKLTIKTNTTEQEVDIDQAWVWVRLERELGLTISQAAEKYEQGSTYTITYALWIASEATESYDDWMKTLESFEVVDDEGPKDSKPEA